MQKVSGRRWRGTFTRGQVLVALFVAGLVRATPPALGQVQPAREPSVSGPETVERNRRPTDVLLTIGDSLSQGTMDATANAINTSHAYVQLTADSLAQVLPLRFSQPLLGLSGDRLSPRKVPTNLGVSGADIYSIDGIEYYKRVGVAESFVSGRYVCDARWPFRFDSNYDKVLYPINLESGTDVTQIDAAIHLINDFAPPGSLRRAVFLFWAGNNDASLAALGSGGENPMFLPLPLDQIEDELPRRLTRLLRWARARGLASFAPYTRAAIERNLTDIDDFAAQFSATLDRIEEETGGALSDGRIELFVLTLPDYSSIAYLFDSQDIEFYLQKANPRYLLPPSFKRIAAPGEGVTDGRIGDRISLLTFGFMYSLLETGSTPRWVNRALERWGRQEDGLVLAEHEHLFIRERIDSYNEVIAADVAARGQHLHVVDVGPFLTDVLLGDVPIVVGKWQLARNWARGGAFSLDGVHPGYTGHALIANYVLQQVNAVLGLNAPLYNLEDVLARDPYLDRDGDGFVPGLIYDAPEMTELLFLLTDPDDQDASVQPVLPDDVWDRLADIILGEIVGAGAIRAEAEALGLVEPAE